LTDTQRMGLKSLLHEKRRGKYEITWLVESVEAPKCANILEHLQRLQRLRSFGIPGTLREEIHKERLTKFAELGKDTHIQVLREYRPLRQFGILVAIVLDFETRVLDEMLTLHARLVGMMHNESKAEYREKLLADAQAMRESLLLLPKLFQALDKCRRKQLLPFDAIDKVINWESFRQLVQEIGDRTQHDRLGPLPFVVSSFNRMHRYAGALLAAVELDGAPAVNDVLEALAAVRRLHGPKPPVDSQLPRQFIPDKWRSLVETPSGIERRYYELCALTRFSECLRSGDIWVNASRKYRDFEDCLLPKHKFTSMRAAGTLPLAIETDCEKYFQGRLALLSSELVRVEALARSGQLEGLTVTESKVRVARHESIVPLEAVAFSRALYALLPRVRITEVFQEVDAWTGFTRCFTDRRNGQEAPDKLLLHATLLGKGLNLGFEKMAQACRKKEITADRLQRIDINCARAEVFPSAFGMLLKAQKREPISKYWGDATTSSSDGQQFRTTRHAYDSGTFNPHYGSEPGRSAYTHVSDLWLALYTTVITGSAEEAAHVLDGLLYLDGPAEIREHYTDTAGFSDHVFAFTHLYGYRFAPWVRNFSDYALHLPADLIPKAGVLRSMVGEELDINVAKANFDEMLRVATSIKHGTVRASEMMRKLGSYPRRHRLSVALREFGRIERSLFMLQWISDPEFRRRVRRGLNKGEAVHALTLTVASIGRAGELRDRTLEQQIRRANGFQLLVSVISLWNTVYLNRAFEQMKKRGEVPDERYLAHVAPLGHEHISLTGDYIWDEETPLSAEGFRPLNRAPL
jgi:TnpA family transposase